MTKKAILLADLYTNSDAIEDFNKYALDNKIEFQRVHTYASLSQVIQQDNLNYFLFRNAFVRFKSEYLDELWRLIDKCNFSHLYGKKEQIIVSPNYIKDVFDPTKNSFECSTPIHYLYKPKKAPIPIITYTHNRLDYLKLTLNSILFSIQDDDEARVHLVMSAPTPEVKSYCLDLANKKPQIVLYEAEDNVSVGATNILVQWLRMESFMIIEDDFILPHYLKNIFPYWLRQLNYRLENFNMVGLLTDTCNTPFDFYTRPRDNKIRTDIHSYDWIFSHPDIPITGNGTAMNTKFYIESIKNKVIPPFYILPDGILFANAKNTCFMPVYGYHIGWNQEMDGFHRLSDSSRHPQPKDLQKIKCHTTGETKEFKLSEIINL